MTASSVASASSLDGDWQSEDTFTDGAATNPNGVWSYGVYDSGYNNGLYQGGTYSLAAAVQPSTFDPFTYSTSSDAQGYGPGNSAWTGASDGQPNAVTDGGGPVILYNYNAGPDGAGYGFNVPAGSIEEFDVFGPTVERYTAPTSGEVTVSATFTDPLFNPDYTGEPGESLWSYNSGVPDYLVMHNGSIVADQIATDATNASFFTYTYDPTQGLYYETYTVNATVSVSAGDTIDFVVNPQFVDQGAYDPEGNQTDPVLVSALVVPTPEPSSLVLLGIAGIGLALAAWKRRSAC
ncbi:MAG TPA: PEP-CTERM sorting domain-containing protein [Pirellulales bacterium]|jgi:hypothetical protein|nr:PEP-CTERM sorting domain-containing protein [Pirellulales bacterium]